MKKVMIAAILSVAMLTTSVVAENIKMGVILGFTGPIESLTPTMAGSAELAFKEASDSGSLLGGETISVVRANSYDVLITENLFGDRLVTSEAISNYGR